MALVTHSSLAMLGLGAVAVAVALWWHPAWLTALETRALDWLRQQQVLVSWLPENTAERVAARDPAELPPAQMAVAFWLSQKYRVAPEPMAALVVEAHALKASTRLDPHLILAVVAIESSFHPYVQSHAGAQGLMQVMGGIHAKKYEPYGGGQAAFDPIVNLRVGSQVLAEYVRSKGSLEQGLRFYLGGDNVVDDNGYVAKVLAEQARLDQVAAGQKVPTSP